VTQAGEVISHATSTRWMVHTKCRLWVLMQHCKVHKCTGINKTVVMPLKCGRIVDEGW